MAWKMDTSKDISRALHSDYLKVASMEIHAAAVMVEQMACYEEILKAD